MAIAVAINLYLSTQSKGGKVLMNNQENNKNVNTVCWLDVVIFEDNTFAVEIYYVDIVKEFREQFNKHTFTTIEE